MSSKTVNFKAHTGNTFDFQIDYFLDKAETQPFPLTGYTVACKIKDSEGTVYGDSTVGTVGVAISATIPSPATDGIILVVAEPSTTINWPAGDLFYDVQLTHTASGVKKVIIEGEILVKTGIT